MSNKTMSSVLENDFSNEKSAGLSASQLNQMNEKCPNDLLHFIVSNRSDFLFLLKEKDTGVDLMSSAMMTLGKACNADSHNRKTLNKLIINFSTFMNHIVINVQRYLISLKKLQTLDKQHLDALYYLTVFLSQFQLTLPSSSLDSISMLLPLLDAFCSEILKRDNELYTLTTKNLNLIKEEQKRFFEHHSFYHKKELSENEKLQLQEPPENFRSLSILPTIDDIDLPCSFLRPNLVKGKYTDAEHYLDVQFRLLREDFIKPLRDGVAEYISLKKNKKSLKNCKNVRVYCDVFIHSEEFVDGDLLHVVQFRDNCFSTIKWENSKRFLTGNLLCFSTDDFRTILFATVVQRDPKELKKGLLEVKFVEMDEKILNIDMSVNYVVIEVPTLFESYRHNLKVLQEFDENSLPMKNYIVNVAKTVNKPEYLQPRTIFDMRPLLYPIEEDGISNICYFLDKYEPVQVLSESEWPTASELKLDESPIDEEEYGISNIRYFLDSRLTNHKYEAVPVLSESEWPTASELKLDESQYIALKSAITKEFAIIQGPPGTGKTYIGLRIVQLLLHNLNVWYDDSPGSLPILIVCYTNHALDQFLEAISKLTKRIVRIGGRVLNGSIAKFKIKNLVKWYREYMPWDMWKKADKAKKKIKEIKEKISLFEKDYNCQSTNNILHENILREFIPRVQYNFLMNSNYLAADKNRIYEWLEIDRFSDVQLSMNQDKGEYSVCNNNIRDKELEMEDEADIEFTENQRNIDYYDFNDRIVFRKNSRVNEQNYASLEQEWQYQNKNIPNQYDYIRNSLKNNPTMKEYRALRIRNIWMLPINERWQLYKFWLGRFHEEKNQKFFNLQNDLKIAVEELSKARIEEDLWVLESAQVVGMTTTGAAKYRHVIEARNPVVLIVEEAAEILESHIITSLTANTKHVILIGDQQQLRPSPTVYALAVKYGMNISLFERMIVNGMDYNRLSLQHRMRPEIASLIVPHIYSDLRNHEVVTKFENIKGIIKSMFFISHTFEELHVQDSKSKSNEHEAKFTISLCKYIIQQGYDPSQITVLTTYSGQLFILKKLAVDEDVSKVRFTVVDNYQGEENDIILISFVRSNLEGDIGFLKVSNRVCVALSRAKKGLYCIGNFEILAQNSHLWKNILQTLTICKSIGPSLRLICQNHPNVFNDVASDSDFHAVPDGGCNRKCEYLLPCEHLCTLFCHPYDKAHENFKCQKPCIKTCKKGHPCQKICFDDCKPCPVVVEKVLSRCGHTVNALCGENELKIKCTKACEKLCKEGHPCQKKCFDNCKPCPVVVEKVLSRCGHIVNALCGVNELEIKCTKACKKLCKEGHPCPKKCFEICDSCNVIIEKTLSSCGHSLMAACGEKESEIKCKSACKKTLPCSHQCKNKCYEPCEKKCLQLVEIQSPLCGHSFKVECCYVNDPKELAKRCSEPCKIMLHCGHLCNGTCSDCKQGKEHIFCEETCQKQLPCGHLCSNKCMEPCVVNCNKIIQTSSSVCGHLLKIKCYFTDNSNYLSKMCNNPCQKMLPCGHTCRGSCGKCYQGRLHVSCSENCNRKLICGHKCEAKCSACCPPCGKPCENRCMHRRCPNKCGDPCVKCFKLCNWSCSHKKCTRRCYEVCDRNPCNVKCQKKLSCSHPCVGFCGEPCPKKCLVCDENTRNENSSILMNDENFGYIYLEDCKHTVKEDDLKIWLINNTSRTHEIKLKTCPDCGTIIRMNFRFNKIIKSCIIDVEKIKQVVKYDKNNNLGVQRNLLTQINKLHSNINYYYKSVIKVLSGGHVRDIYVLANLECMMNIAREIELKTYGIYSMFALTSFTERLIVYMRSSREWIIDFINRYFLFVSEYQLQQLSVEVYRVSLLDLLLKIAREKHFASLSPEFEKCASSLMNFKPLSDENIGYFKRHIKNFLVNMNDVPLKNPYQEEVLSMSAQWYRCSENHIISFSICSEISDDKYCYKCRKLAHNNKLSNSSSKTTVPAENYSENERDFHVEEALEVKNFETFESSIRKNGRCNEKNIGNNSAIKIGSVGKVTNTSTKPNPRFSRNFRSDTQIARKSYNLNVPEWQLKKDIAFSNDIQKRRSEALSSQIKTYRRPIFGLNNAKKSSDKKLSNQTKTHMKSTPGNKTEKSSCKTLLNETKAHMKPISGLNNVEKSSDKKLSNQTYKKQVELNNTEKRRDKTWNQTKISKKPTPPGLSNIEKNKE